MSTQTFTGANTFTSSFTVQSNGNQIVLSTSSNVNDISINSDGSISFFPELHNSSSTIIPEFTTSVSSYGPCVTGSTLAITTTGGRVEILFTGTVLANGGNSVPGISFLIDGGFARDLSSQKGFSASAIIQEYAFGLDYILDALPVGVHQFCLSLVDLQSSISVTLVNHTDTFENGASNIFFVKEIK